MPRRRGDTKKMGFKSPSELCNNWKELNKNKFGKLYKTKKDCLDFVKKTNAIFNNNLTANQKKKQNKTKGGTLRGGRYKTILERIQDDPKLCHDWKEINKTRGKYSKVYKNKKDCVDTFMNLTNVSIKERDKKRQSGTRRR